MLYCAAAARPIQNWDIIWEHNCTVQKKQGEKKRNGWKFCEIFLGKTRHFHELLLPYESHLLWGEECLVLKTLKSFVFLLRGQFKVQNVSLISFFVKNIHISKTQDSRTSSMSTVPIPSADFSSPTRLRVTFFAPSNSLIPRLLIFLDCIQSPRGVETLVEAIEYVRGLLFVFRIRLWKVEEKQAEVRLHPIAPFIVLATSSRSYTYFILNFL